MADNAATRRKGGCLRRILRIGGGVLLAVIVLSGFAAVNQRIALARELRALQTPGQLVDVEGRQMHLYCVGQGSPTVVIDAGNADFSLSWIRVQAALAEETRVCTYDRAGYGWSDPVDTPRDAEHIVRELHVLLAAENSGPYLLIGHSLGGLYVQHYALTYPDQVSGLLLVDNPPAYESFIESAGYQSTLQQNAGLYTGMRYAMASGMPRLLDPVLGGRLQPEVAQALPEVADAYVTLVQKPAYWQTALDELSSIETTAAQVRAGYEGEHPFGDLPLIVLSAGETPPELADLMVDGHTQQATLSSTGERRVVEGSSHLIHLDAPEAAIQAVQDLMHP